MSRTQREEIALALAQSEMSNAMRDAGLRRTDLARKIGTSRPFVTKLLSGGHNLTVAYMAKVLDACGFEIRFQRVKVRK